MPKKKPDHFWYARNPAKIRKKTAHLSLAAKGAYSDLLDWYYLNKSPLPQEWAQMYRICGAVAVDEQTVMQAVVQEFFVLEEDGWHNPTADEELAKAAGLSQKRREAQAEGQRKKAANEKKEGHKKAAKGVTKGNTVNSLQDTNVSTPLSPLEIDMLFQNFWNQYPGIGADGATGNGYKGSKTKALESFSKLLNTTPRSDHEDLCRRLATSCEEYRKHLEKSGYAARHASTWLNQQGWKDDYTSTAGKGKSGGNKHERAKSILGGDDPNFLKE